MDVERMDVATIEEQWAAWEARCGVSHAPHFTSLRNDTLFFHRPTKPRNALRVALATSGGLYVEGMPPFDMISHAGDDSIRWIPRDVVTTQLRFAHDHYDHTDADQDPNCMFPLDRLRELVAAGEVGAIASVHVGLMGYIPDPQRFARETVPGVVSRLVTDHVDAVVLAPGWPICHRSVGLMQNAVEEAGIATVSMTMVPYVTAGTGVPRALYVRFPYGNAFGEPGDADTQRTILASALQWLYDAPGPNALYRLRVSWRRSRRSHA